MPPLYAKRVLRRGAPAKSSAYPYGFRSPTRNAVVSTSAQASATMMALHTPSMPHTMGSSMTVDVSNTSVRMKLMSADTLPLLSAVKNAEP